MCSSSLTSSLFSLFKMTMSTSLLHTKQAAVDQSWEQNWHWCSHRWEWQHKCCTRQKLYKLSASRHIFVWHLHDNSCWCCCCCWACYTKVSAEMCQSKEISHTRDKGKEVEEERKRDLRRKMREIYNSLHWEISWSELSSELYKKENHMSASNKNFICKSYLYEANKHMSTDNDNHTTTFSDT